MRHNMHHKMGHTIHRRGHHHHGWHCKPHHVMWPGFGLFILFGILMWTGFSPWAFFAIFFFVLPMLRGSYNNWGHYDYDDAYYEGEKRKNEGIKRKNDDNTSYIRSSDGEWLEIIDRD